MQSLEIGAAAILRHRHHEQSAVRSGTAVDDRSGRDPDLWRDLRTGARIARSLAGGKQAYLLEQCTAVGIVGVDAVVLGRNIDHVVQHAADGQLRHHQRRGINQTIGCQHVQQSETGAGDINRSQHGLGQVLTGAHAVVVIGQYVGRGGSTTGGASPATTAAAGATTAAAAAAASAAAAAASAAAATGAGWIAGRRHRDRARATGSDHGPKHGHHNQQAQHSEHTYSILRNV